MRRLIVLVLACSAATVALADAALAEPHCLTPVAADGAEPPCNPHLASPIWGASHRSSYAQASSPYAGLAPGGDVSFQHVAPTLGIPIVLQFTEPYPDGGRAVWFSTVATPDGRNVYKLDYETGEILGNHGRLSEGDLTLQLGGVSGAYSLLDRDNHLIVARGAGLDVYADEVPGERRSGVAKIHTVDLSSALCRPTDALVGITMLYSGRVAFATEQGVVGTIPRKPGKMKAANVRALSLNGAKCGDGSVADDDLGTVSNSIAADEDGGIYVVTSKAMHRLTDRGGKLTRGWRAHYEVGGEGGGARLGAGSGSTPSLMGTDPGDERFVVITDGQELMHLVLMWRDRVPRGWRPIAPGKARRIACEVPVTFGNPQVTESLSEQSVLVRGNSTVVVNNSLALDALLGVLPEAISPLSVLTGQIPQNAPYGIERIDWDPATGECRSVWANPELSIPNGIPTMSTRTGLFYGIGQRDGVFGVEGVDYETGQSRLWAPSAPLPTENSFFAATTVGPDGSIWTGTFLGVSVWRSEAGAEAPRLACKDIDDPSSRLRQRSRITRKGMRIDGRARDRACGEAGRVAKVRVAVSLKDGHRCRPVLRNGRLGPRSGCKRRRFLRAKGRKSFALRTDKRLPRGTYRVWTRAIDRAGNREASGKPTRIKTR